MLRRPRLGACRGHRRSDRHCGSGWERAHQLESSTIRSDSRGNDRTEPRALDDNVSIRFPTRCHNLTPNVLSFAITVCPDHKEIGRARFRFQVPFDHCHFLTGQLVLALLHDLPCRHMSGSARRTERTGRTSSIFGDPRQSPAKDISIRLPPGFTCSRRMLDGRERW